MLAADWSPDGKALAVIHAVGERYRLEYPIGRVLYEPDPPVWLNDLSVSPDGTRVVFVEHPVTGDGRGGISIVGANEPRRSLASGFTAMDVPRWSPDGREVWFSASRAGGVPHQFLAVSLTGRERVIAEQAGPASVLDVSPSGRVLIRRQTLWVDTRARATGASQEVELPAADLSFLADLSDDGKQVLGTDTGVGGGPNFSFYVQKTDGSAPVWLGEGDGQALSPDGRQVLALLQHSKPQQLVVAPTGAGETRTLEAGPIVAYSRAVWDPSGERIVIAGADASGVARLYAQDKDGGPPRPITGEDVTLAMLGRPVSPDGRSVVAIDPEGIPAIYPLQGGEPRPVPGLNELDLPLVWTPDGRELIVVRYEGTPLRVERVEVASGRTRPWHGIGQAMPSFFGQTRLLVTPDGAAYAYAYLRSMSDLYLSSPLR